MKKIALFIFSCLTINLLAQDFLGLQNSNYAGINGLDLQPASIVDNRYKLDILLVGDNLSFQTNNYAIKAGFMNRKMDSTFIYKNFLYSTTFPTTELFLSNRTLGPSFMLTINEKNSIAFSMQARFMMNFDGMSKDFTKSLVEDYSTPELMVAPMYRSGFDIKAMAWTEYGLSYGREVYKTETHYFKAATRLKLLQGLANVQIYSAPLNYSEPTDSTISITGDHFGYSYSQNLNGGDPVYQPFQKGAELGFGADIGVVYEWRPHPEKHQYEMDCKKHSARDENKYKIKVGASLLDLGGIRFNRGTYSSQYSPNGGQLQGNMFNPDHGLKSFDSTMSLAFPRTILSPTYTASLPTALSLQIDYHIWKPFFVNFTAFQALRSPYSKHNIHDISTYSITPRIDGKWFGLYIPISYNEYQLFKVGAAAMIGPFIVGTNNLGPVLWETKHSSVDFYVGLKVSSLHHKKDDRDKDKVSDAEDNCPEIPGICEFKGCPDTDGDSIPDKDDACPKIPGLKKFKGCPDTDMDGVEDQKDKCMDVPGLIEFDGCPDKDGDKIIDKNDSCPDIKGLPYFHGCPDTDGDSLIDKNDTCPTLAGPKSQMGCPDTDGDGILDHKDSCVTLKGLIENHGCPEKDEDFDGTPDKIDDCPKTPGPADNKGCPVLKKEEVEILNTAFANLEFETSKAIIKPESFNSLDELAALMLKKPTWKLRLAGHTDNVGDKKKNLKLSKDRTEAVAAYLTSKGVDTSRLVVEFYGSTKPIADNKTAEGRQRNRRVEMSIIFE